MNTSIRSSHPEMICEKDVLKYFAKFTGKHLRWSLFLIKLQTLVLATLNKKDSNTGVFCEFCKIFENTYFEEHLQAAASVVNFYLKKLII